MLGRILGALRGKPALIKGTGKLPEGHAKKVDLGDPFSGGVSIVLCRVGGEIHALDTRCPHEGGFLVDGPLIEGKWALCPLHNYRFDPKTGAAFGGVCKKARTYKTREKDGDTEVWV